MITKIINEETTYAGTQLGSRFINAVAGTKDDALVAFIGPADVPTENLVDEEDRQAGATIKSRRMVHFLIRLKDRGLDTAIAFQRLCVAGILEILVKTAASCGFFRDGDDIYLAHSTGQRKLTVSIATTSLSGDAYIHIGVNVNAEGSPVPATGLNDIGVDELDFTSQVAELIERELNGLEHAAAKVRPVE